MKKFINLFILLLAMMLPCANANPIDKAISDCGVNQSAIAISVREVKTGKELYTLNARRPMIPASTLKLLTYTASVDALGQDFKFSTELYKSTNNDVYLKLMADPFLETDDLKKLIETAVSKKVIEPKQFFIDDYIIDNQEWGEGWQWDNDLNPLMPKFSAYNLDKNLLTVIIDPTIKDAPAQIYLSTFYPVTFMNLIKTGSDNNVELTRKNHISPDIITAEGTVKKRFSKNIPVNNPKRYLLLKLEELLRDEHMEYYNGFKQAKLPPNNVYLVDKVEHELSQATTAILKESNNFVAESLFKIAGGKFANQTGTIDNSIAMLNSYINKKGLKGEDIRVVDGSGVSKNNLMTADFMTDFLTKEADNTNLTQNMSIPSQGTLENRMLYFKDNLKAKTGTVSNVSALAGYLITQKGTQVAFDIMINDSKSSNADKKMLEEYVLRAIFSNY